MIKDYPKNVLIILFGEDFWNNTLKYYTNEQLDKGLRRLATIKLTDRQAKIFIEYHSSSSTLADLAEKYNVSRQSIDQNLHSAYKKLQNCEIILKAYLSQECKIDELTDKNKMFDLYMLGFYEGYELAKKELQAIKYKNVSINELNISSRAKNLLKNNNIKTVQQLMLLDNLQQISNLGRAIESEIKVALNNYLKEA